MVLALKQIVLMEFSAQIRTRTHIAFLPSPHTHAHSQLETNETMFEQLYHVLILRVFYRYKHETKMIVRTDGTRNKTQSVCCM